jgi:hypothetical protein
MKIKDNDDEQWKSALAYINTIPELNYLTQIVIMLYEDTSVDENSDKRFHVELHFSPGSYAEFDNQNEKLTVNKTNENLNNKEETLGQNSLLKKSLLNLKKSLPISYSVKKLPISSKKIINKNLQTLVEPKENIIITTTDVERKLFYFII